ncbi:MAG TPA: septum formation initiator family protein [Candidatus Limnocylindria bacterium]|nr:septum formation initiator family protein [Candidatus Limnocylindria bacterium]
MTGLDLSAAAGRAPRRPRYTLPASRGGMAWLVVLLVVGAFVTFQVGRQVYASWSIGQEANRIRAEMNQIAIENAELRRELDYLRSDAYISQEARKLLNIGRPGERVLIIPPGSAVAPPPADDADTEPPPPLLKQWVDLFFGS